jgi:hypothetical protein
VGCIVDSCRDCAHCSKGLEQYCSKGSIAPYNSQVGLDLCFPHSTCLALLIWRKLHPDHLVWTHGATDKGSSGIRLRAHLRWLLPIGKKCCSFEVAIHHWQSVTVSRWRQVVVDEDYVIRIPDAIDLAKAAPLLCAGISQTASNRTHFPLPSPRYMNICAFKTRIQSRSCFGATRQFRQPFGFRKSCGINSGIQLHHLAT